MAPSVEWGDLDDNFLHPVPAWRFWVTMPDIPGVSASGDVLGFLCQKFTATYAGIDYEAVPFQAGVRNFPTSRHTEALSAVYVEDNGWQCFEYLAAWCDIVIDDQGNFGLPSTWKQNLQIDSLDHAGNTLYSHVWRGCGPTRPDPHDYDGTHTNYLPTSCTFTTDGYDRSQSSLGYAVTGGIVSGVVGNLIGSVLPTP